jgi:hypothetical protein
MTRAAPERAIQIAIKRRLALSGVVCHHSPNAGKRSVIAGRMLKAEGMITGWPDLTLVGPDKRIAFLEVKAEKGRPAPRKMIASRCCAAWAMTLRLCAHKMTRC